MGREDTADDTDDPDTEDDDTADDTDDPDTDDDDTADDTDDPEEARVEEVEGAAVHAVQATTTTPAVTTTVPALIRRGARMPTACQSLLQLGWL